MTKKKYYIVGETKSNKILGYNLTETEKNVLFYHIDKGDGHKSSEGRFYTATEFKVADLMELRIILSIRSQFKNYKKYSYVLLTDSNKWLATGKNEDERMLLDTIALAKEDNPDENDYILYETTNNSLTV